MVWWPVMPADIKFKYIYFTHKMRNNVKAFLYKSRILDMLNPHQKRMFWVSARDFEREYAYDE